MNTNTKATRILVYGDSFTFGKIPGGARFEINKRYTGVLQNELGIDFEIIEEGLRGRTVSGENGYFEFRNGFEQFGPIFGSHLPIDILVFYLGTNDTNSRGPGSAKKIADGFDKYKDKISWWCNHLGFNEPKVVLISPPNVYEKFSYKPFGDIFKNSEKISEQLPAEYEKKAKELNWYYFDSSKVVEASKIDGIHLDEQNNEALGKQLAKFLRQIGI